MFSARQTVVSRPVARSEGLLIENVADEVVIYDLETKEAHCLKALAAVVFAYADGEHTIGEIAELASDRLATAVTEAEVTDAVSQLEQSALLDTALLVHKSNGGSSGDDGGISRRDMVRRIGFAGAAAAVASPLITSVTPARGAVITQSGIITGCSGCTTKSDCISNHCCQSVPGKQCAQTCCVGHDNSCHITNCTCQGGSTPGADCTTTACGGGGTCVCNCTVCLSSLDSGEQCPTVCPNGSRPCCTTTC